MADICPTLTPKQLVSKKVVWNWVEWNGIEWNGMEWNRIFSVGRDIQWSSTPTAWPIQWIGPGSHAATSARGANSPGWNASLMQECCFWSQLVQSQVTYLSTKLHYTLQTNQVSCWSPYTVYKLLHVDYKTADNPWWATSLDMWEGDIQALDLEIGLRLNLKFSCGLRQGSQPLLTCRLTSAFRLRSVWSLDLNTHPVKW